MNGCVYRTTDDKCEFYSDYGKGIVSYCDFDDCEEKKPSNADRIRAMTDEELAEFIEYLTSGCDYMSPKCYASEFCTYGVCHRAWLDWLKQEVKDG